jgi:hypothetical protein
MSARTENQEASISIALHVLLYDENQDLNSHYPIDVAIELSEKYI